MASVQHRNSNSIFFIKNSIIKQLLYCARWCCHYFLHFFSCIPPKRNQKKHRQYCFRPLGNLEALLLGWHQHGPPGILRWIRCCSHGNSTDLKEPGKIRFLGRKKHITPMVFLLVGNGKPLNVHPNFILLVDKIMHHLGWLIPYR